MAANRNREIKVRLTEQEHADLLLRSKSSQLAKWVREHCLGAAVPKHRKIPPVDPVLLRQIAGISNNVNQIARAANRAANMRALDKVSLLAELSEIDAKLSKLLEQNTHDS